MFITKENAIRNEVLLIMVVFCAMAVALAAAPFGQPALASDSLIFYETARHILAGDGLNYQSESPVRHLLPLTAWAPGYPLLLAAISWITGFDLDLSASLLNLVALVLVALIVYHLCGQRTDASLAALVVIVLLMEHPIQFVAAYALSEGVFLPMPLLVLFWAEKYLDSGRIKHLLLMGLFAVLGAWIRHAGAVFLAIGPLVVMLFSGKKWMERIASAGVLVGVEALLMLPVWVRNYELTGFLSGSGRGGSGFWERIPNDLGVAWDLFVKFNFAADTVIEALFFWPMAALVVFLVVRILLKNSSMFFDRKLLVPLFFSLIYFLFIIYARVSQREIEMLGSRMLSVVWPMLFIVFGFIMQSALDLRGESKVHVAVYVIVLLKIFSDSSIMQRVQDDWYKRHTSIYMLTFSWVLGNYRVDSVGSMKLMSKIGDLHGNDTLFFDTQPHVLEHLTGIRTYRWTDQTPCSYLEKADAPGTIVIINQQLLAHAKECVNLVPGWSVREVHGGLMF